MSRVNAYLARRLLVAIFIGVAFALLATVFMQYTTLTRTMEGVRDRNVDASLSNMLPLISESMWAFDVDSVFRAAEALLRDPYISGVVIHSVEGEIDLKIGDLKNAPSESLQPTDQRHEVVDQNALLLATPVTHRFNDEMTTIGWIYLRSDNHLITDQVRLVLGGVLISALVVLILLLAVLYGVVQRLVAEPIQRFSDYVERITPDDFSQWTEYHDPRLQRRQDEVGRLYQAFRRQHHNLIERDKALQEHRSTLEQTVEQRTLELQESNQELSESLEKLKIAQQELLQSEKLASLGNLVSGVAHEVNTPLGISITAASHLHSEVRHVNQAFADNQLKKSDLERFLEECRETSDLLSNNLDRAARLVSSFKQVAVDQSSEEKRRINLRNYVDEILSSLLPKYKKTPVEVHNDIETNVELTLEPGALSQIVTNLIINSLLHGFDNGQTAGTIRLSSRPGPDNTVLLTYKDDGRGMSEETLKHIFDPFYTTRRSSGGSGLGMNIVFNLVTGKLGGRIKLDSPPYQGCHITIRLPLTETVTPLTESMT